MSLADLAKGHQGQLGKKASQDWIKNNVCLNSNIPKLSGLTQALGSMKVDEAHLTSGHCSEGADTEQFDCKPNRTSLPKDLASQQQLKGRSPKSSLSSSAGSDSGVSLSQLALMHQQQKQTQCSIQAPRPSPSSGDRASAEGIALGSSVSAGINISQASTHFKAVTGSPKSQSSSLGSDSLSLAELASRHQQTHSKGFNSPSSSLAELAKQHSPTKSAGGVSLSALAQQHNSSTVQGSERGLSLQALVSGSSTGSHGLSNPAPGLSLAQLASSHKAVQSTLGHGALPPGGASMKTGSQLGGVSLASLAKSEGTLCLSDLLKSKVTISGSRQLSADRTPSPDETSSSCFSPVEDEMTLLVKVQCDATLLSTPSVLGKALCLQQTRKRKASDSDEHCLKYPRFTYAVQAKDVRHHTPVHKREVKLFDFSTPSPDDLVRQRQRGAFTRTGERHVSS